MEKTKNIILNNALFVPELRTNLLLISKMTDKGNKVLFKKHKAIVISKDGRVQMIADQVGDLYFARQDLRNASVNSAHNATKTLKPMGVWHKSTDINEDIVCDVCCKGKMIRRQFPKSVYERNRIIRHNIQRCLRTDANCVS